MIKLLRRWLGRDILDIAQHKETTLPQANYAKYISEEQNKDTKEKGTEVSRIVNALKVERERNSFSEKMYKAMRGET